MESGLVGHYDEHKWRRVGLSHLNVQLDFRLRLFPMCNYDSV